MTRRSLAPALASACLLLLVARAGHAQDPVQAAARAQREQVLGVLKQRVIEGADRVLDRLRSNPSAQARHDAALVSDFRLKLATLPAAAVPQQITELTRRTELVTEFGPRDGTDTGQAPLIPTDNQLPGPRIVEEGLAPTTTAFPEVALLLQKHDDDAFHPTCSATLVDPSGLVTAAHCFCHDRDGPVPGPQCRMAAATNLDPSRWSVFFQHAGLFRIKEIIPSPGFSGTSLQNDLAYVRLDGPVAGIAPAAAGPGASLGDKAQLIGWGIGVSLNHGASAGTLPPGLKQFGTVTLARCSSPFDDRSDLCWDSRPDRNHVGTCGGDSGGPLRAVRTVAILGVTSGGPQGSCTNLGVFGEARLDSPDGVAFLQAHVSATPGLPVRGPDNLYSLDPGSQIVLGRVAGSPPGDPPPPDQVLSSSYARIVVTLSAPLRDESQYSSLDDEAVTLTVTLNGHPCRIVGGKGTTTPSLATCTLTAPKQGDRISVAATGPDYRLGELVMAAYR